MRPRFAGLALLCVSSAAAQLQNTTTNRRSDDYEIAAGKRTFLFGKLVLVPVLAAIGLKFLALLPIVLSKIAILSVMNFLSTNLNLLVSTLLGFKSFLGKYGLWAQEDTKHYYPEIETFSEFANSPLTLPAFRYSYVMDKEPMMGRIEPNKPPKLYNYKVYNGFAPSDSGSYKMMFDRRTKLQDRRPPFEKIKEHRSIDSNGKYKCFWTNENTNSDTQVDVSQTHPEVGQTQLEAGQTQLEAGQTQLQVDPAQLALSQAQVEVNNLMETVIKPSNVIGRRNFDVADTSTIDTQNYGQQMNTYPEFYNGIGPPINNYHLPNIYEYQSYPNANNNNNNNNNNNVEQTSSYRQVATHNSADKIDSYNGNQLPFTHGQVKVSNENYGDTVLQSSTQRPFVYLMSESTTSKFNDDNVGD